MSTTPSYRSASAVVEHPDAWQSTRAQTVVNTQPQPSPDDDPAESRDIGRLLGNQDRELFVSCDPAQAMQQQFDHLQPEFIALHDLGSATSRKLLAGVAAASGRAVRKLMIRRQGYGTTLATLQFVDFPNGGNNPLRIYTLDANADADAVSREHLARVLLSYSRLGVIMVGEMPAGTMASSLSPLREAMVTGRWHNRELLLLPLSASNAIGGQGTELGRGTGVNVRITPQITRPADAWSFISGTWNRLREQAQPQGSLRPAAHLAAHPVAPPAHAAHAARPAAALAAAAPSEPAPLTMTPMPSVRATPKATPESALNRYVRQLIELTGMVSVALFDAGTGRAVLHAGARPGADDLAQHGSNLLAAMTNASRTLGLGHALPEAAITLGAHHLLLRAVPHHPGLAVHCVLDKTHANLTLARLQIARMDSMLNTPG